MNCWILDDVLEGRLMTKAIERHRASSLSLLYVDGTLETEAMKVVQWVTGKGTSRRFCYFDKYSTVNFWTPKGMRVSVRFCSRQSF